MPYGAVQTDEAGTLDTETQMKAAREVMDVDTDKPSTSNHVDGETAEPQELVGAWHGMATRFTAWHGMVTRFTAWHARHSAPHGMA